MKMYTLKDGKIYINVSQEEFKENQENAVRQIGKQEGVDVSIRESYDIFCSCCLFTANNGRSYTGRSVFFPDKYTDLSLGDVEILPWIICKVGSDVNCQQYIDDIDRMNLGAVIEIKSIADDNCDSSSSEYCHSSSDDSSSDE